MSQPLVSVVIPAYNQADYLGEAIESVLDQTYPHFEILVVDDASPDHTGQVVRRYSDLRLKYIVHEENRMLAAARNTGIRASAGEIVALLDADDIFHPQKLQAHVDFLDRHPQIGVTYNARFDIYGSKENILDLWRPPSVVDLSDLVLGFPFAPSDMVLRRDWIDRVGLFDESYTMFAEDLDINCRLALAGSRFAAVNRVLNYRRFQPGRAIRNIAGRLAAHLRALDRTFSDPRCPAAVLALRNTAVAIKYLGWACIALAQNETQLGQDYIQQAARLKPAILQGKPCPLVQSLLDFSITRAGGDHQAYLASALAQLPPEMTALSEQFDWAVGRGYLLKGTHAILWNHFEAGREYLIRAQELGAEMDRAFARQLAHQVSSYELEFGSEAGLSIIHQLQSCLSQGRNRRHINQLEASYLVNSAFSSYQAGNYARVSSQAMSAISRDPRYLTNRGVLAILFRSLWSLASSRPVAS